MPAPGSYRGRFAPSPTGALHLGSLVAALGSWLLARKSGGRWLVRIEDLDPPREVAGAAEAQLRMLSSCALHADGPILLQSERGDLYRQALDRLLATGDAFECHCSRSDLAADGGIHRACKPGRHRDDPSIRLRVPDGTRIAFHDALQGPVVQDVAAEVGDFVLRRTDGLWAYQLAVVVDDAAQAISDVVRGADLLDSTPRQILLQRRLGLPTPRYVHLPLVTATDGSKLSKSLGATALDGARPLPALRAAWHLLGQAQDAVSSAASPGEFLERGLDAFDPDRLPRNPQRGLDAVHNASDIRRD